MKSIGKILVNLLVSILVRETLRDTPLEPSPETDRAFRRWFAGYGIAVLGMVCALVLLSMLLPANANWFDAVVTWSLLLGPPLVAFLVGTKFRSWWWMLGPVAGMGLVIIVLVFANFLLPVVGDELAEVVFALGFPMVMAIILGFPSVVAAAAGVWWGKRRQSAPALTGSTPLLPDKGSRRSASPATNPPVPHTARDLPGSTPNHIAM